jgi:hypothetical protein
MLESALHEIRTTYFQMPDDEPLHFIVSGDFARTGTQSEFYLTYEFLNKEWSFIHLNRNDTCGLRIGGTNGGLWSVPGNHDHWNGRRFPAPPYNLGVFPDFFKPTPERYVVPIPGNRFVLELFTVDSNEGLRHHSQNQFANGLLSSTELTTLERQLRESKTDQANDKDKRPYVRAIICHHGFTNHGGLMSAGPLDPQSAQALLTIAHRHDVTAILTGHTHYFEARDYPNPNPRDGGTTWELRSAATLQMDPQPRPQGFWVHEIRYATPAPTWTAWQFEWDGIGQFARRYPALIVR